jgi:hemerythrin
VPLVAWSENYSVGVQTLDSQHINLFDLLNELHERMKSGTDVGNTGPLLRRLLDYTRFHFTAEEKVMQAAHFPGFAKHREQHDAMTQRVTEFLVLYESGHKVLNVDLLFFLRDWLHNHILREDREYSAWLKQEGVA